MQHCTGVQYSLNHASSGTPAASCCHKLMGSPGEMELFLTARVHESLAQFLYADATFYCERLHAFAPSEVRQDAAARAARG